MRSDRGPIPRGVLLPSVTLALVVWCMGGAGATPGLAGPFTQAVAGDTTTFVVLGHLRGDRDRSLHSRLGELLDEVRDVDPDFVVLTGDMIWGDPDARREGRDVDPADIVAQWTALDSALDALAVPIHRVPGNHDIHDQATWDVYLERYDSVPAVVDYGRSRLVILSSAWEPGEPDRRAVRGFGYQIDPEQLDFLREVLADEEAYDRAFVFVHHVLWWEPDDAPWWTEVHPILAAHQVDAVFSGDYGPAKFSHTRRDGIEYFQSGIAPNPLLGILQGHEWNRLLASQFDNYLIVRVRGDETEVEVATVGEVSSGHFSRERWWEVHGDIIRPPTPGGRDHLQAVWERPKGKVAILAALGGMLVAGFAVGLLVGRRVGK